MSTFKDRLLQEKIELDDKVGRLDLFIQSDNFQSIGSEQMSLLNIQLQIMKSYSQVLLERITKLN